MSFSEHILRKINSSYLTKARYPTLPYSELYVSALVPRHRIDTSLEVNKEVATTANSIQSMCFRLMLFAHLNLVGYSIATPIS